MIDHSKGCQGREYACSCGYDNHTDEIKERYSRLIESMRTRLTDQITPLASKHTIGSLLAEVGESQSNNKDTFKERRQVEDETEILQRLASGDTIVFSMDGDMAWFTKGDRAFVGDAIMSLREKGYLLRKRDAVDDDDDPRGIAFFDTISDAGRAYLSYHSGEGQ